MNQTSGRDALVMGNGPSVDQVDGDTIKRFYTFGTNHIYKKFDAWGTATDAVVITDSNRIAEIGKAYQNYPGKLYVGNERVVFPNYAKTRDTLGRDFVALKQLVKPKAAKYQFVNWFKIPAPLYPVVFDKARFPMSYERGLNFGYSVVISSIQIAIIEGFRRVLLTGVDSHYATPKSYFAGAGEGINYVNHTFIENPRLWMEPLLVNLQIALEDSGIDLIDCTPGGKLRFIRKGTLAEFGQCAEAAVPESSIVS